MINDYVVQWSTANRDNVAAQLMGSEIIPVANQNQASHLLVTLLDVMERARRAPTLLESLEALFTAHCVSLAQAAVRPARITAAIRIDASATSSRRFRRCFRVLLNASRVSTTASRGSSVNREAIILASSLRLSSVGARVPRRKS